MTRQNNTLVSPQHVVTAAAQGCAMSNSGPWIRRHVVHAEPRRRGKVVWISGSNRGARCQKKAPPRRHGGHRETLGAHSRAILFLRVLRVSVVNLFFRASASPRAHSSSMQQARFARPVASMRESDRDKFCLHLHLTAMRFRADGTLGRSDYRGLLASWRSIL
jgi:hypothetical protein